jgi:hypothetical protein
MIASVRSNLPDGSLQRTYWFRLVRLRTFLQVDEQTRGSQRRNPLGHLSSDDVATGLVGEFEEQGAAGCPSASSTSKLAKRSTPGRTRFLVETPIGNPTPDAAAEVPVCMPAGRGGRCRRRWDGQRSRGQRNENVKKCCSSARLRLTGRVDTPLWPIPPPGVVGGLSPESTTARSDGSHGSQALRPTGGPSDSPAAPGEAARHCKDSGRPAARRDATDQCLGTAVGHSWDNNVANLRTSGSSMRHPI